VAAFVIFLDELHGINFYIVCGTSCKKFSKRLLSDEIGIICGLTLAVRLVSVYLSADNGP
jgi:hypothetical protein